MAEISSGDQQIGEVYLHREEIAARVRELGAEIARDYAGKEPILVAPLKASMIFLVDLSRALPIPHTSTSSSWPASRRRQAAATNESACSRTSTATSPGAT